MTDNRMIIATIVGTGIAMTTVIVAFVGIVAGGINNRFDDVNSRIDDVNATVNNRISDLNTSVNNRFEDMKTSIDRRFDEMNASIDRRFDAVNRRIDDLQAEMRELRALVIDAIQGAAPAADND